MTSSETRQDNDYSDVSALAAGAKAASVLATAYLDCNPPQPESRTLIDQLADDERDSMLLDRSVPIRRKTDMHLLMAEQFSARAFEIGSHESLRRAVVSLFFIGFFSGHDRRFSTAVRHAAIEFAAWCGDDFRVPSGARKQVRARLRSFTNSRRSPDHEHLYRMSGADARDLVRKAIRGTKLDMANLAPSSQITELPSATAALAEAAAHQSAVAAEERQSGSTTEYDLSDSGLKVHAVELTALRGSPGHLAFSFDVAGTPRSTIIFGDNGSGKSTIVDALEFALQGRVGRSINFNSPLSPSLRSFIATEDTVAVASLSDGSSEQRRTREAADSTIVADPEHVRPGFRLAPITLKRPDIVSFLDTEALERGSILLDYFPDDAKVLALRPIEQDHRLATEATEWRIRRSKYSRDLATFWQVDFSQVENSNTLRRLIKEKVMGGVAAKEFEESGGWERVPEELRALLARVQRAQNELNRLKKRRKAIAESLNPVVHRGQAANLRAVLSDVGAEISRAFGEISREHPVDKIDVIFGESGPLSLDILVHLKDGTLCFPQQIFSEAYRDLISLLFFVSVAKKASERGQAKVLVLDDVLQSVDAQIRHAFVSYLLQNFSDWQLIFTVHDRLWLTQLKDLFEAYGIVTSTVEITSWSYTSGVTLGRPDADLLKKDLVSLLQSGEPRSIGVLSGQLLETICNQLSWRLNLRVPRRKDDRYTLGDLWPVVKERLQDSAVQQIVQRVASYRALRNLTAHYDLSSLSLTRAESQAFADAVLDLYSAVRCTKCSSWLHGGAKPRCTCGHVVLHR